VSGISISYFNRHIEFITHKDRHWSV